ncbi:DNA-3-methyladenine glycosylase [Streptomyces sp. CNQ085]|uniref:DNA-3-methyladenine glycosylase n=1 Tax=Streptomyces sp. CNQ085 TaxID=2886944 RepID=UPI0035AE4FF4
MTWAGRTRRSPLPGPEVLAGREHTRRRRPTARNDSELAKGPARPVTALDVARLLADTPAPSSRVRNGPRAGVDGEGTLHLWRYWITGDPSDKPVPGASAASPSGAA